MFGLANKTVIGLDVGSHTVKAVALQPTKDRITLLGYAQAKIGTAEPATVVKQVVDALGIKSRRVVTSVSGRSVIVRQIETPKLGQDELKNHIAYEADKYIPFGADEVIIDCQPMGDKSAPKDPAAKNMQVLLVAVRRSFIEEHLALLRGAGVYPEIIDVDVFAVANAYELLGPPTSEEEKGATALIDIGASKSNIAIIHGKRLLFTREVYMAGNEITEAVARSFNEPPEDIERIKAQPGEALDALIDAAMPALEDLANEIRLSFDYVEGQFEQQVEKVVLTGGTSQLASIGQALGQILNRPVHVFDPVAGVDLVPSKYDLQGLDANAPGLTVALGLAAHIAGQGMVGLGGSQSHGWQPRHVREGGHSPRMEATTEPMETAEPPAESQIPPPSHAPLDLPASALSEPPPMAGSSTGLPQITPAAPPAFAPLTPPGGEPAQPGDMLLAPPISAAPPITSPSITPPQVAVQLEAEEEPQEAPGVTTSQLLNAQQADPSGASGLLVVLDDDQEMPPSERHPKTGRKTRSVKLEQFDDQDSGPNQLPNLPKI